MIPVAGRWTAAVAAAAGAAALSVTLTAFGDPGHRVIGTLAEMHLRGTRALDEVKKILRPGESLADAAVWPDRIKDPLYEDGDTPLFRLNHPGHDTYHYANLPFQTGRYDPDVLGARSTDIVQTARECIRVLRGGKGSFTRREALRLLAHTIGDLHQPLHTGNPFVSTQAPFEFVQPNGPDGWHSTLGGNLLVYGPQHRFNLHSYWDSHAVNITMGSQDVAAFAARLLKEVQPSASWRVTGDADGWPAEWATESITLSKEANRGIRITGHLGPDELHKSTAHRWTIEQPADYDSRARAIVRTQLAAGGFRLAETLKAIWVER
jgi:hypothetical protein